MDKKVGRNDPCPCGSGKKYKHCCMGKQEEAKKTYTTTGKRKFKAKVITLSDAKGQTLFQGIGGSSQEGPSLESLKFRMTKSDFRIKPKTPQQETPSPSPQQPSPHDKPLSLEEDFKPTKRDYREN